MKKIKKILNSRYSKKIINFLRNNKKILHVIIGAAVFTDIFFYEKNSDFVVFGILFTYIFFVLVSRIESKSIFILCILLLLAMFFGYLITGTSVMTEKAAVWFVLLMGFGVIRQWKE